MEIKDHERDLFQMIQSLKNLKAKGCSWSGIHNTIDNLGLRILKYWSTKAFPMKCSSLFHLTEIFHKAMSCFMKDSKQMANMAL